MPDLTWIAVLILTLAVILLAVTVRGLRSDLRETARRDEAAEVQARALLARRNPRDEPPDGEDGKRRRHLWLVPIFAGLAAAGWVRQHPGPAAAGAAAAGAAVLALLPGSSPSDSAMPPTPPAPAITTTSPRSPSLPIPVPAPGAPSSTKVPAGGTPTSAVPLLDDASTSSTPTTPTISTTTATGTAPPTPPATTTTPPDSSTQEPEPERCLLRIELRPVLDLCLPLVL